MELLGGQTAREASSGRYRDSKKLGCKFIRKAAMRFLITGMASHAESRARVIRAFWAKWCTDMGIFMQLGVSLLPTRGDPR